MTIKKTLAFLSIFIIALLAVGCGQKESGTAQDGAASQTEQQVTQDSTGLDQSAVQEDEAELSTSEMSDIDAGLSEIENI